uniref:Auxin efflux carrier component n=1 Tax=Oryza punctata TaxID=4537 RepID=A0A0E0MMY8_ORYPU
MAARRVAADIAPPYAVLLLVMVLARCVRRHGRLLTPERCEWANWLVANVVVPFFVLQLSVVHLDLAHTDYRLVAADSLSKVLVSFFIVSGIVVASLSGKLRSCTERFDSFVTLFSISALTSTLAVGVPMTAALYGKDAETVVVQLAVLQILVSSPIVLLLFYVRKATAGGAAAAGDEDVELGLPVQVGHIDVFAVELAGAGKLELPVQVGHVDVVVVVDADDVGGIELPVRVAGVGDVADPAIMAEPVRDDGGVGVAAGDVHLPTAAEVANGGAAPRTEELPPAAAAVSWLFILILARVKACVKFAMDVCSNPNIVAALLGIGWAFGRNRLNSTVRGAFEAIIGFVPPRVGGLAMMFSMGLSLGCQEKIMACSWTNLVIGQTLKFIIGPIAMFIASKIVGLHGDTLRIAIIQAAIPQAITSFIFAKEFGLHAEVVGTMVITGMLLAWLFLPLLYAILRLTV